MTISTIPKQKSNMEQYKVIVCGGRDFNDSVKLNEELDYLYTQVKEAKLELFIISGTAYNPKKKGSQGADGLAHAWALLRGVAHKIYPADWGTYGRAAGPIRNQQMLSEGKPNLVVAFPGGKGTANMILISRKANVIVREVA